VKVRTSWNLLPPIPGPCWLVLWRLIAVTLERFAGTPSHWPWDCPKYRSCSFGHHAEEAILVPNAILYVLLVYGFRWESLRVQASL